MNINKDFMRKMKRSYSYVAQCRLVTLRIDKIWDDFQEEIDKFLIQN